MTPTRTALLCCWLIGLALLPGCLKQAGDRCQVSSDCASGLVCNLVGATVSMGGICEYPADLTTLPDMTQVLDLAGVDQSVPPDAGPADAGARDGGG